MREPSRPERKDEPSWLTRMREAGRPTGARDAAPTRPERERHRSRVRVDRRRPDGRRRLWPRLLLVALAAVVALGLLAVVPVTSAGNELLEARAAMERGRDALLAGDAAEAREAFSLAEASFIRAGSSVENPVVRLTGLLPYAGRSQDTASELIRAGVLVARAGRIVSTAVLRMPGGADAFAPRGGAVPLEPFSRLLPGLEEAADLVEEAAELVDHAGRSWLLPPVARARREFRTELRDATEAVAVAGTLAAILPAFLGARGSRRYFFGTQNPAELRGTGGFIGAYSIVTARDGRLEFGPFNTILDLRSLEVTEIAPPNSSYADRYNQFGGAGLWQNINMTPDFPSAAEAIERLYERVTGDSLDGTILADPFALAALLEVAGPVEVPEADVVMDAGRVVRYVANEAYGDFAEPSLRKRILGRVSAGVFEQFLQDPGDDLFAAARVLVETAAEGHLLVHATDPDEQAALEEVGISGALTDRPGDYLNVVANNASGTKIDFYVDRTVRYEVHLEPSGDATGRATLVLGNHSPTTGQPDEVIGPYRGVSKRGESITYVSVYCSRRCTPEQLSREGIAEDLEPERELGLPVVPTWVRLPSGASESVEVSWTVDRAWIPRGVAGGLYRLTFRGQTTIRPTRLVVEVSAPGGTRITRAGPDMTVTGDRAVWRGQAGSLMTFAVAFERDSGG